jgi:hypothetical protein
MNRKTDGECQEESIADASNDKPQLFVVWEHILQPLSINERMMLLSFCYIIMAFGVLGNVLTLIVISTRFE